MSSFRIIPDYDNSYEDIQIPDTEIIFSEHVPLIKERKKVDTSFLHFALACMPYKIPSSFWTSQINNGKHTVRQKPEFKNPEELV